MESVYGVVLAGGSGKRLWPLSRYRVPKQLITLGGSTLLHQALTRLQAIPFITDAIVVTTQEYAHDIESHLPANVEIISEPCAKNTAAAVLLSCLTIAKKDPQALVVFTPADHVINQQAAYSAAVCMALTYSADHDQLVLLGVTPTHASTGYGYIERGRDEHAALKDVYPIVSFHEKPDRDSAQKYIAQQTMLWNCGIFCARVSVFIELFMRHMPELYAQVKEGRYEDIVPISFDKGIVEKVHNAAVVHGTFSWTDVGTLEQFIDQAQQLDQHSKNVIMLDARNVRAFAQDKLVIVYGVENICVIETADTIVVMNTQLSNSMDRVVEHLHKKGYENYL